MSRAYFVVDAFTGRRFNGNAAAVVLDTNGLDDSAMQAIAAEFNLSETTFVVPPLGLVNQSDRTGDPAFADRSSEQGDGRAANSSVRFRWFTPAVEARMCGHATIAGVHALVESGRVPWEPGLNVTLSIHTLSGTLTAFVEELPSTPGERLIWLELRPPKLEAQHIRPSALAAALRLPMDVFRTDLPVTRTQDADVLVFVDSVLTVNASRPDFHALGDLLSREGLRGLSLATVDTLTPSIAVQSRFFAPAVGVDEDPVTGSVHGPLAAYLVHHGLVPVHDGTAGMMCVQGKPGGRTGLIFGLVEQRADGLSVRIGGQAVTTMRGRLVD